MMNELIVHITSHFALAPYLIMNDMRVASIEFHWEFNWMECNWVIQWLWELEEHFFCLPSHSLKGSYVK